MQQPEYTPTTNQTLKLLTIASLAVCTSCTTATSHLDPARAEIVSAQVTLIDAIIEERHHFDANICSSDKATFLGAEQSLLEGLESLKRADMKLLTGGVK